MQAVRGAHRSSEGAFSPVGRWVRAQFALVSCAVIVSARLLGSLPSFDLRSSERIRSPSSPTRLIVLYPSFTVYLRLRTRLVTPHVRVHAHPAILAVLLRQGTPLPALADSRLGNPEASRGLPIRDPRSPVVLTRVLGHGSPHVRLAATGHGRPLRRSAYPPTRCGVCLLLQHHMRGSDASCTSTAAWATLERRITQRITALSLTACCGEDGLRGIVK